MSLQAIQWALELELPTPAQKAVLLALANYADPNGRNCYPSCPRLARNASIDERTVTRVIAELEHAGHIAVRRRPGLGSHYELAVGGALPAPDPREGEFDVFALAYPRLGSRFPALRAYLAARNCVSAADILERLERYKAEISTKGLVPAARWLAAQEWPKPRPAPGALETDGRNVPAGFETAVSRLSGVIWESWFGKAVFVEEDDGGVCIRFPTQFMLEHVKRQGWLGEIARLTGRRIMGGLI
jgi:hypothetical protein